jgi:hypothetical protein
MLDSPLPSEGPIAALWARSLSLDGAVAPVAAGGQMTLGSTE